MGSAKAEALALAMETEKPFIGLFFQEERPTMNEAAYQLVQQAKPFEIEQYMKRYA